MAALSDCSQCMQRNDKAMRSAMGCGYLLPTPGAIPWSHRSGKVQPITCVGYLVNLPEVSEASRARLHWSNGAIVQFGYSENLLAAIEILEGECNSVERYMMEDRS